MSDQLSRREFIITAGAVISTTSLALGSVSLFAEGVGQTTEKQLGLASLAKTHDLRLPEWGCYNNVYNGLSHIADIGKGLAFELGVFPGFFRREVMVANVKWESGFHPWEAAADLSYFAYRYEMLWKDELYCDVSFSKLDETTRVIRAEFVNNTKVTQNAVLHYMAYLYFPPVESYSSEALIRSRVILPDGAQWFNAVDYEDLEFATPQPRDGLAWGGRRRGEIRDQGFVSGSGIGNSLGGTFGKLAGDKLVFVINLKRRFQNAALVLRYRTLPENHLPVKLLLSLAGEHEVNLLPSGMLVTKTVLLGQQDVGKHTLSLVTLSNVPVEIDGFALVETSQANEVQFVEDLNELVPEISPGPVTDSIVLKYKDAPSHYGLAWHHDLSQVREFHHSELDRFFRRNVQDHVKKVFVGDKKGHFTNVFIRPIVLPPGERKVIYGLATSGTKEAVQATLSQTPVDPARLEQVYENARARRQKPASTPAGEPFRFSHEKMAATVLTNVVYPVYARRSYLRHNSPGKWWDSLYTWDSGFIGLGFTELDLGRAIDCLNAYTTEPGDVQSAFLHVGTPLPVQIFHFWELWNRTQSRELLEYFYPRVKHYHDFLAGRSGSSTTRRLRSNLLTTWDYFYNTGWDDYPPQKAMHDQGLVRQIAPVITTAYCIRTAKMLRAAAKALGADRDIAAYDEDIALWSEAIQKNCWDADSGYFSYVNHDPAGNPTGIFRHSGGQNFNLGMDGVTPIVAGICTKEQFEAQLANLRSEKHLWTRIGLSTVDQSAAYYRKDGYWNGSVWMPEQWFMWKAMMDWGQGDFAHQIARTALQLWKSEVDESYNCFEHFLIDSGRGAGWHQFGALSSPVLNWFAAYFVPGTFTAGFDAWIRESRWRKGHREFTANIEFVGGRQGTANFVAVMDPGVSYQVTWNAKPAKFKQLYPGALQIEVANFPAAGRLAIEPI